MKSKKSWSRRVEQGIETRLDVLRLSRGEFKKVIRRVPPTDRDSVRHALSEAMLRQARHDCRIRTRDDLLGYVIFLFGAASTVASIYLPHAKRSGMTPFSEDVIAGAFLVYSFILARFAIRRTLRRRRPTVDAPVSWLRRLSEATRPQTLISVSSVIMTVIFLAMAIKRGNWSNFLEGGLLGATIGLIATLVTAGVRYALDATIARKEAPHALDAVMIQIAYVMGALIILAPAWRRSDVARYLVERLEYAARQTGKKWSTNRTPFRDWRLRRRLILAHAELADLIRAHKAAIASIRSRTEFEAVINSLSCGLVAMAEEDWIKLLANATPDKVRQPWYRTYLVKNVTPATLLGLAAAALPWLPPFRGHDASILGVRVTLGVYALLRLVPGTSLTDLVDKGMSRGFDAAKSK